MVSGGTQNQKMIAKLSRINCVYKQGTPIAQRHKPLSMLLTLNTSRWVPLNALIELIIITGFYSLSSYKRLTQLFARRICIDLILFYYSGNTYLFHRAVCTRQHLLPYILNTKTSEFRYPTLPKGTARQIALTKAYKFIRGGKAIASGVVCAAG